MNMEDKFVRKWGEGGAAKKQRMNEWQKMSSRVDSRVYLHYIYQIIWKKQHQLQGEQICVCMLYVATTDVSQDGQHLPGK